MLPVSGYDLCKGKSPLHRNYVKPERKKKKTKDSTKTIWEEESVFTCFYIHCVAGSVMICVSCKCPADGGRIAQGETWLAAAPTRLIGH